MQRLLIDADGHVMEYDQLSEYIEEPYRSQATTRTLARPFPSLDFHHLGLRPTNPKAFGGREKIGPKEWVEFAELAGFQYAVLYPTNGLAYGNISSPDWAVVVARAYNNWLHEQYLKASPKLKGMALIPMQDVSEAVTELRRAVTQLGMVGAMLPSRGLAFDLGHRTYWPVYAEAEKLGCALGVHGGAHHSLGLDSFDSFVPIHGLGHPFQLMIAFTGMVYHGVFDQYPKLRVGFMEGGAAWATFWADRLDRSHHYFSEFNPRGAYRGPAEDKRPSEYVKRDTIFIGCEGSEEGLAYHVHRAGKQHFLFASDFPHEIGPDDVKHEIEEVEECEGLTDADKAAILGDNARRFYKLGE